MPRKIVTLRDKYGSTTRYYPKIIEECLPEDYQGLPEKLENNYVKAEVKALSETIENEIVNKSSVGGLLFQTRKPSVSKRGAIGIDNSSILLEVEDNSVANSGYGELELRKNNFKIRFTDGNLDIHTLTFDTEGKLKVDGQAVGGGGKQLYEHNIFFYASTLRWYITITNDTPTQMTFTDLLTWLNDNNFKNANFCFKGVYQQLSGQISFGFRYGGVNTMEYMLNTGSNGSIQASGIAEFIDTVVTL